MTQVAANQAWRQHDARLSCLRLRSTALACSFLAQRARAWRRLAVLLGLAVVLFWRATSFVVLGLDVQGLAIGGDAIESDE